LASDNEYKIKNINHSQDNRVMVAMQGYFRKENGLRTIFLFLISSGRSLNSFLVSKIG